MSILVVEDHADTREMICAALKRTGSCTGAATGEEGLALFRREHFEWVREYGNKRFYEYPLATAELKRLGR